jgi:hypothetical protein
VTATVVTCGDIGDSGDTVTNCHHITNCQQLSLPCHHGRLVSPSPVTTHCHNPLPIGSGAVVTVVHGDSGDDCDKGDSDGSGDTNTTDDNSRGGDDSGDTDSGV